MTSQTSSERKTRARSKRKSNSPRKGNGTTAHSPKFLAEFGERGRELQHEGLRQVENIRIRLEEIPSTQRLLQQLETGSERLYVERERVEKWASGQTGKLVDLREQLAHQLGLATSRDIDRIGRKIGTLRSQIRNLSKSARG